MSGAIVDKAYEADSIDASVVVCVYHRPVAARRCVESLLSMAADEFEIVLFDDASTDNTPNVLVKLKNESPCPPVVIGTAEKTLGVSGARNLKRDAALRSVVAGMDSDCTVDKFWLLDVRKGFESQKISTVAGTVIDDDPTNLAELAFFGSRRIGRHQFQGRRLIAGNMAIRRSVLDLFRFDEAFTYGCDEGDLANRLAKHGHQFACAPNTIVYHNHPTQWRRCRSLFSAIQTLLAPVACSLAIATGNFPAKTCRMAASEDRRALMFRLMATARRFFRGIEASRGSLS